MIWRIFTFLLIFVSGCASTPPPISENELDSAGEMVFEVYSDKQNKCRWRLLAANNRIIAEPGQGYKQKASCLKAIELVKKSGNARTIAVEE